MTKRATSKTTVATVEQVLITDVLVDRPGVVPGKSAGEAFVALAGVMANAPDDLPQALCDMALDLCEGGTAGICILRTDATGQDYFFWEAVAGQLADNVGGTTPRDFSPCGTSLDRGATQLYAHPSRFYTYLNEMPLPIVEALVVPFLAAGKPLGCLWVLSHDKRRFNSGHAYVLEQIAAFCGAAFHLMGLRQQAVEARSHLETEMEALRVAGTQLQENLRQAGLTNGVLSAANQVKDDFLSMVSHELRSPIAAIYGNAQILRNKGDTLSPAVITESLQDIESESLRLSRIIEDLLVLARPEVGEPTQEPVCIGAVLRAVIQSHRRQFPGRRIELIEARPEIYAVGSESFLEHTARNLIGNAEKYSPSTGVIQVSLIEANGEVCVLIRDEGDGVLPLEEANIFKPFYRSPKTAAKAPGIGIGLAVSKRLIEAQRGRIWVQAAANGGAEFCFTLPALAQDG
jgi:signal transduction histidine kinase